MQPHHDDATAISSDFSVCLTCRILFLVYIFLSAFTVPGVIMSLVQVLCLWHLGPVRS